MKTYSIIVKCLIICLICSGVAYGMNSDPLPGEAGLESKYLVSPDSVKFHYYSHGEKAGYSSYIFSERGKLVNSFALFMENMGFQGKTEVEFDENGLWQNVLYENNGNAVIFSKKNGQILISTPSGEKSVPDQSDGNVLEDMTPALIQSLLLKYANGGSGNQGFRAFFVPGLQINGELEYKGSVDLMLHGKELSCYHYRIDLSPVYQVDVLCLASKQILMLYYEAQNGAFIRVGYEELLFFDFKDSFSHKIY